MATSIMKQCNFCHGVGHNDRTCAKKREWMAKKQQAKAAKDMEDTSSVASMSTTVTIPSPETTPKPPVKLVQPVKPSSIALSESEEREARKIEKKLREIEALEKRLQQGETLRPHEVQKLQQKSELEDRSVMHKVRLGCRRYDLKAAFESSTVEG
eukprot:symbB.v1.2.008814.t1/scaffold536.1/size343967/30